MDDALREFLNKGLVISDAEWNYLEALYLEAFSICHEDHPGNFLQLDEEDVASSLLLAWVTYHHTLQPRIVFIPGKILHCRVADFNQIDFGRSIHALDGLICEKGNARNWLGMLTLINTSRSVTTESLHHTVKILSRQFVDQARVVVHRTDNSIAAHLSSPGNALLQVSGEDAAVYRWQSRRETNGTIPARIVREFNDDDPVAAGIPTLMSVNERFQLYDVVMEHLPIRSIPVRFIEVGSFAGGTFYEICCALQRRGVPFQGVAVEPLGTPRFYEVMKRFEGKAIHLALKSFEAAPLLYRMFQTADLPQLILIDGDHSYEGVCRDIHDYYPLLAPGGLMIFHDYLPPRDRTNGAFVITRQAGADRGVGEACRELMEEANGLEPLDLPLLFPTDPTPSLASQAIIPGVFSTVRVYRKPVQ